MRIKDEADALVAVRECGRALEFVPEALRTPEVCLAAVKQDGWPWNSSRKS